MTPAQINHAKEMLPFVTAVAGGHQIERRVNDSEWTPITNDNWMEYSPEDLRVDKDCDKWDDLRSAAKSGKVIQFNHANIFGIPSGQDDWQDIDINSSSYRPSRGYRLEFYRIKPEPVYRPWRPCEVPVGKLIRRKGTSGSNLILAATEDGWVVVPARKGELKLCEFGVVFLLESAEHSVDGGKSWLPCGVECL